MPTPRSRITADVHRIEFIALKVHVKPLPPVDALDILRFPHELVSTHSPNSAPPHCFPVPNLAPFPRNFFPVRPSRRYATRSQSQKILGETCDSRWIPVWRDRSLFPCSRHQQSSGKVGTCPSTCSGRINSSPRAESLIFALSRAGCRIFCSCVLKRGH